MPRQMERLKHKRVPLQRWVTISLIAQLTLAVGLLVYVGLRYGQQAAVVTALALGIVLAISLITMRHIAAPVLRLHAATQAPAEDEKNQTVIETHIREIDELGRTFSRQVRHLQQMETALAAATAAQRAAEQAQQESEAWIAAYGETSRNLIWESDADGIITYLNPAWEEVTGYKVSELLGRTYLDFVAASQIEVKRAEFEQYPEGYDDGSATAYVTKSGDLIYLTFHTIPRLDADKQVIGTLGSAVDVTERVRADKALRESRRRLKATLAELQETQERMIEQERLAAVGQLSAGIAHDFNNILASIVLYTQMSLRSPELSPTLRRRLAVIGEEANHAADLVQQILDFGRRAVIQPHPADVNQLLQDAFSLLRRTLPESIRITLTPANADTTVHVDPTRFKKAITNLALNANDAMPDGGHLHLEVSRLDDTPISCAACGDVAAGDWVCVSVTDTGEGISSENLPHIFEPFFTTRSPLRSGLGLAQVFGIVKQHEGHIDVRSEVGVGTTVTLAWPALTHVGSE